MRWLWLLMPLLLIPSVLLWKWPRPREAVYSLYRERGKAKTLADLEGYERKQSEHFEIYYTEEDANVVDMILTNAESVYEPVVKQVGFRPTERVPLVVYASRDDLRRAFGWGQSESALGVYWSGTIRLLSPNVWIDEDTAKEKQAVFRKLNPLAHELTHYVLDYMTSGNYPRWFTEGLAQRVEYKVTGYLWIEPESTLRQDRYTLADLQNRFDQLRNQPLAYRQSFLLVDYMAREYGEESLTDLIHALSVGSTFDQSVERALGDPMAEVFAGCNDWMQAHLQQLDPAS